MTNLLTVLPEFDIKPFTHLLPSLEKALITTADLLTLDSLDVAKRANVPPLEVRKLNDALFAGLQSGISHPTERDGAGAAVEREVGSNESPDLSKSCKAISTLDDTLDAALTGGIATGYLTEIVGESAVGKTQFLLTLLLSVQLPSPQGSGRSALYISTEAPLQTTRLAQILNSHPKLSAMPGDQSPSLSLIHSTHIHDVEAQEHILRYQVPVAIEKQNIGLLVIDSMAANYRAEFDRSKGRKGTESFAKRSNQLTQLGALLRNIAQAHNIAVVVANQVADRFTTVEPLSQALNFSQTSQCSRPVSPPQPQTTRSAVMSQTVPSDSRAPLVALSTDDPLALDHQQRFFTGWGDDPTATNFKTPSLGLTWTNQLATRVALLKEPIYEDKLYQPGEDRNISDWNRTVKVVFSAWCAETKLEFKIWEGGIRATTGLEDVGG